MQEMLDTAWQRGSEHAKILFEQPRTQDTSGQEGEMGRRVAPPERKARLLTDLALAYLQWGKHSAALTALQRADAIAPAETRSRASGRRIFSDPIAATPGRVGDQAVGFAKRAGVQP